MGEESKQQTDAFKHSIYLKLLQEAKNQHKPLRIAFVECSSEDKELSVIITNLKKESYAILLNSTHNENQNIKETVEGIASASESIASLRQIDGEYQPIINYHAFMKQKALEWRAAVMQMIARLKMEQYVPELLDMEEIEAGGHVTSLDFRFALDFNKDTMGDTENYTRAQRECVEQIAEFKKKCAAAYALHLRKKQEEKSESTIAVSDEIQKLASIGDEFLRTIIDLRVGQDSNIEKHEYYIFLSPNRGTKDSYIAFMIGETCKKLAIARTDIDHVLIFGDNSADLKDGVQGINALADPEDPAQLVPQATFFIPRKSLITNVMQRLQNGVDGVKEDSEISAFLLNPATSPGQYTYKPSRQILHLDKLREKIKEEKQISKNRLSNSQHQSTQIILGDETFPQAQTPAESLEMYLSTKYPNS